MQLSSGLSSKFYSYQQATPSNSPLHRGRVDYQAVPPPVQGGGNCFFLNGTMEFVAGLPVKLGK